MTTTATHAAPVLRKRAMILEGDDHRCFIERETLLNQFDAIAGQFPGEIRYAECFAHLMGGLSTPIGDDDVVLGSMEEGLPAADMPERFDWKQYSNWNILGGPGHMTVDHPTVVREGLAGILRRADEAASRINTERARMFAVNARRCILAIRDYAARYAAAAEAAAANAEGARRARLERAARALARVPFEPADDFFSAVQSCWLIHMVLSCCSGGRDYGWGRMDQYLLPYYRADLAAGRLTHKEAVAILADFFLNANQIAGNARALCCVTNHDKPVPSQGSKQYIILGGTSAAGDDQSNELSFLFLEAAMQVRLREPVLQVRIHPAVPSAFKAEAMRCAMQLQGQVQFSNDTFIPGALIRAGIDPVDAYDYTASGCSRTDAGPTHGNLEHYLMPIHFVLGAMKEQETYADMPAFLAAVAEVARRDLTKMMAEFAARNEPFYDTSFTNDGGVHFHLESLFLRDCVDRGLNTCEGGTRYRLHTLHMMGIATAIDSLMTIQSLVFEQRHCSLRDLLAMVEANYEGHADLWREIRYVLPKFGNGDDTVDALAEEFGRCLLRAMDALKLPAGHLVMPSFYSLNIAARAGERLGATPDGRRAGEPISENQSPTYGTDMRGPTAVLNSVARLPFARAGSGCLNLQFPNGTPPEKVMALVDAFFRMGGSIVGLTITSKEAMQDARVHPERHRTLQVRIHGFSEYFVNMPDSEQTELINRTLL